jgi:hypothetical protein
MPLPASLAALAASVSACLLLLTVVGVCSCEANVQQHHTLVYWQVNLRQQQKGE